MAERDKGERIRSFYRDLCLSFAGCIRSLTLYPEDHPETRKKLDSFFTRVARYCEKRPGLSILFLGGEVIVENNRLPELSKTLGRLISRFEEMRFQRLVFRRGLTEDELVLFLQLLLPLIKKPSGADLVLAKNQERLPHIIAGALPFEAGPQVTYEELSGAIEAARDSVLSFSSRIKDLLDHVDGPLSAQKTATAQEVTEAVRKRILSGEIPLKVLIYRRSSDPDPYLHAVNVAVLSMALAERFKIKESVIREIGLSALVHDIGLHGGTQVDFNKSASLTLDEKRLRWEHPVRGAQILMASPGLPDMVPIVAYEHHLHFDGSGYPRQKVSRDLNMASMIVCIANTFDNLRRNRPESGAVSLTEALNRMDRRLGTFFHPLLFKQFRAMVKAQAREAV